jgi:hypothetical protein
MAGETFVAAPGSGSTCRCDVHQTICMCSRSITATRPAISKANCLAVGRWTVRSLFNSSIADAPKRYNFSLIVRSLVRPELSANRKGRCVSLHIDSRGNRLRRYGLPHIAGDGLLAEFGGVYDAAATEIHRATSSSEVSEVSAGKRVHFCSLPAMCATCRP